MSKLCLSTYLNVLALYKSSKTAGQSKILNGLVKSICANPEIIDAQLTSHIIHGRRNLPQIITDELEEKKYQNPNYLENFKSNVEVYLHPGRIVDICKILKYIALNDDNIDSKSTIDFILQTKKNDINPFERPLDFIAGVFLYVVRLKNDNTQEYASEITENYCKKAIEEYGALSKGNSLSSTENNIKIIMDSDIPSQAKSFCRKYEDSIELLSLCQIANIVNPKHNHVNRMYSDYCDCSAELKKQIMSEIACPLIQVDDEFTLYRLLGKFADDIENLGLASKDKTYMFPQYVVKSLSYEELEPLDNDPIIFPIVPSRMFPDKTTSTLSRFIDDYLYYKDTDKALPIPFDWMFYNFNLDNCNLQDLILWLNIFIINCCYKIDKITDNISEKTQSPVIPDICDAKTIEDLHFLALLQLYDTYLCK